MLADSIRKAIELVKSGNVFVIKTINTTLEMAFTSSILALLLGVLIGLLVAMHSFPGKRIVVIIIRTLMGIPPVVVGIVCYVLFSGTGPFGSLRIIYSVRLMIIAQIILITPVVAGMTETSVSPIIDRMLPTAKGLKVGYLKRTALTVNESKYQILSVYLFAFARAISEVGAVQIVGGNIINKTTVMTTYITLNYNTGDLDIALALAVILMAIALSVNLLAALIQWGTKIKTNV